MKQIIAYVALMGVLGLPSAEAQKKEFKEEIKRELSFDDPNMERALVLKNVFGPVSVEGYEGDVVQLVVQRTITASNTTDLELGKRELQVKITQKDNRIFVHPDAPYIEVKEGYLNFSWCNQNDAPPYDHHLDFTVKVPKNVRLEVSTVNDGDLVVKNTRGNYIRANNVNGSIALDNITGQTEVHSINGEVRISYASNPGAPSSYYSLNGDINITYQKNLSAEIAFKSMNGELFTDFDVAGQYAKTSKNETGKGKGAKYRYEAKPVVQIGKGDLFHDFETLNGNVIIKKI